MAEKEKKCDDGSGTPQTRGMSLSLKRSCAKKAVATKKLKDSLERFFFDVSADELTDFQKGECPENTTRSTDWAYKNFE